MKKYVSLLLALAMTLSLAACGGGNSSTPASSGSGSGTPSPSSTNPAGSDAAGSGLPYYISDPSTITVKFTVYSTME